MNTWYYINSQGQQVGPVDKDSLRTAGLCSSSMVWREGMAQWQTAGSMPELADVLAPAANTYNPAQAQTPPPPAGGCAMPGYGQQSYGQPQGTPPQSYMWAAVLTTCFCCLPFGVVAIVNASKVDDAWRMGNHQLANDYSQKAKKWSLWALISGLAVLLLYGLLFIFMLALGAY